MPYPVACSPQAWAAGSLFHLISADARPASPTRASTGSSWSRPALPDWLPELRLHNLRVGDALVDLLFGAARTSSISVEVLRRTGDLDVVVRL